MKKAIIASVCVAMLAACSQQSEVKPAAVALDNDKAKLSYAIGMDIGSSLKSLSAEFDRATLIAAINDRLDGKDMKLTDEDAGKVKQEFFKQQAEKRAKEQAEKAVKNKAEGEKFLAENAKKPGVTVTASGLQYEVLQAADGPKPKESDDVKVHYRGTLLDGTEFDSSYKRGQPITFPLSGVIKGWTEGVQLMNVGSKFRFYIPADLAYGERGAGATIAPNSTLIFEVELLGIEDPAKAE
ncbi:FKBP-type peptidyl-prolyl cis-trans isomerase [Mariprofundus erugo]|uniref:Peptidyl-prolyl cis-trans isomerase n=1 Tax=Mariprofundus erugo TaxID=2528639 RepID=A0A5R9GT33_9PROT|nr:FKBP-type peptidyl-prolyl cis-trans isomerase [Mariprofundus erugo]TLS69070.1 FKBP-type peptidyl-prolyl cis-trans isomerase [Mariprofundus erugo]TLS76012.1 FKBP-type peptidyl-prolyl cis-trans isomerase [Mariprofundus erugo]